MAARAWATAVLIGLVVTSRARAQPGRVELSWRAPGDCPDHAALVSAVEGLLGEPMQSAEQPLGVDAHVQGDLAHGYAAKLEFSTAYGRTERALEHADCRKLTEGVALLVALAIDPERVRTRRETTSAGDSADTEPGAPSPSASGSTPSWAPAETTPAPEARPVHTERASSRPSPRLHPSLTVVGLVGAGMLPGATPGAGVDVALRASHYEAALLGRLWATRAAAVPGTPDARVDLTLVSAGLRLCGVPRHERWSWSVCARLDLGRMSGTGEGVDNSRSRRDSFAALGGSFGVAYAMGRISPVAGVDWLWATSRPRFGVLRDDLAVEAFRPKAWQLTGFIGLSFAL